jgi:hypothetical protein
MDERGDMTEWNDRPEVTKEFSAFDGLAALLISVPRDQIRLKLEDVRKRAAPAVNPSTDPAASGT